MKTLAIIQARVGSTRLPGKVLMDLEGKTVLERVVERVAAAKYIDQVAVATTISPKDLPLVQMAAARGITVFCGSENDVLDRFFQMAKLLSPEHVVRITADCPLIDPLIIDKTIEEYYLKRADYLSNQLEEKLPDGEDVEVFSFSALKSAWQNAKMASEREHVTPYIRNNPKKFKVCGLKTEDDYSTMRWTLDNTEDYEFIKSIYSRLHSINNYFGMKEILLLLKNEPGLRMINSHIPRNEGYAKSLREDKIIDKKE